MQGRYGADEKISLKDIRASAGVGVTWNSFMAAQIQSCSSYQEQDRRPQTDVPVSDGYCVLIELQESLT